MDLQWYMMNTEVAYSRRILILHYIFENDQLFFMKLYAMILKIFDGLLSHLKTLQDMF